MFSSKLVICRMGILVLIITTILKSFRIIICHRCNFILILILILSFLLYLYIVVCFVLVFLSMWAIINYIITNGLCTYGFEGSCLPCKSLITKQTTDKKMVRRKNIIMPSFRIFIQKEFFAF
jgi:hypothetical protein